MTAKDLLEQATNKVTGITPSVLVVARLAEITPAELAAGLADEATSADYLVELAGAMTKIMAAAEKTKATSKAK